MPGFVAFVKSAHAAIEVAGCVTQARLLYRHRLRQVARLVHVAAAADGDVVGE